MTRTYWMNAKPKALIEREKLLGMGKERKAGTTITEPADFLGMVTDIQTKANWSDQGLESISFNQAVYFCVRVVHTELIEQLEGKIPLE